MGFLFEPDASIIQAEESERKERYTMIIYAVVVFCILIGLSIVLAKLEEGGG